MLSVGRGAWDQAAQGTWRTQAAAASLLPPRLWEEKNKGERDSEKSFCNIFTVAFDSGRSLIAPNRSSDPAWSEEQLPRTQVRWRCREAGWGTGPPRKDRILGVEAPKPPTDIQRAKEIPEGLVDPCSGPRGLPGCFLGQEWLRQVL